YFRPWRTNLARQESSSTINLTKDKFEVILDVQQFAPEEITVKATNNSVVVEGKHEEKQDEHGFISRQFTRRYILPTGYDIIDIVSSLSSDGVLTITAPKRPQPNAGERIIPITKTGPAKQPEPEKTEPPKEQTVPIVTSP
ncbi:small heat shock protein, partial [Idiomarina loihiensis]|uniref:Hsp20 family protein n=1 Tax=Idiomarina loihiensis TaxID=135577 RepID=UPI0039BDD0EF